MLPFLKDRHEGSMSGPVETIRRDPDEDNPDYEMLDAIAEDMIEAIHKKDRKFLKDALKALCEYLRDEDEEQDYEEFNK